MFYVSDPSFGSNEFTALVTGQGKFSPIELKGYSHGNLFIISHKLFNNVDINVTHFPTNKMPQAFAEFLEKELLVGTYTTNNRMTGTTSTANLAATVATQLTQLPMLRKLII